MAESKETPRYRLTQRLLACTPEEFIAKHRAGHYDNRQDISKMLNTLLQYYPELNENELR